MITKLVFLCTIILCFYLKCITLHIVSSDIIYTINTVKKKEVPINTSTSSIRLMRPSVRPSLRPSVRPSVCLSVCLKPKFGQLFGQSCLNLRRSAERTCNKKTKFGPTFYVFYTFNASVRPSVCPSI